MRNADVGIGRALPALSFPRHSRGEARARAEVAASFATRPVFAIRDRHYRLTLDGVGMPAVRRGPSDAGVPAGHVRLDDERIDVTVPPSLAWRWLNDLAARGPDAAVGMDSLGDGDGDGDGVTMRAGVLSPPLARALIDCVGRFLTQRSRRALRGPPGVPLHLAWCGVTTHAPPDAAAARGTAAPACVAIRVAACGAPAQPAWQTGAAEGSANHAAPAILSEQDVPLGSILLASAPGTTGAYRLARLLAAACPAACPAAAAPAVTPIVSAHARMIRFHCPVSDASLLLGLTALRRLRRGDVLLPDAPVAAGAHPALLLPTGQRLVRDGMKTEVQNAAPTAAAAEACPVADPTFRVDIAATCVPLGTDAIARYLTSATGRRRDWPAPVHAGPPSTLRLLVQGQAIGIGEWLRIAGRRGVRVLAWQAGELAEPACRPGSAAPVQGTHHGDGSWAPSPRSDDVVSSNLTLGSPS
ncbi:MAG: hypothetical protein ACRYGL_11140 [Janthinobacterium lividum]